MKKSTKNQMLATLIITAIVTVLPLASPSGWMASLIFAVTGAFVLLLYIDPILEGRAQEHARKQWEEDVRYSMKFVAKVQQEIANGSVVPCQYCGVLLPSDYLKCPNCAAPTNQKRLE